MENFLAAVNNRQGVDIIIDGHPVFVPRCRLLKHLQLNQIEERIAETNHAEHITHLILDYLSLAGLTDEQIKKASSLELLEAFVALKRLNAWQWLLPWLAKPNTNAPEAPEVYHYDGRRWAVWIHKLASRYGWSPETIWDLYPEEAAAYIQEIMLSEYYEREDRRALSEVSYKYDASTKTSRFIPSPQYSWMVNDEPPAPVRIPARVLPVGNVIKVEQ